MEPKIFIKKYPNRRLYNTFESNYITIDDVAELIKAGNRVEVQDVTSGDDVTALVLTQIIMNKAKKDQGLLPVSLLHLVIQFGENQLHEFFESYLEKTMENYLFYRKRMGDQTNVYLEMGMGLSKLAEKSFKDLESLNMFREVFRNNK
jgi:polyhydroxyalkanoate synthesis repressor PhaR